MWLGFAGGSMLVRRPTVTKVYKRTYMTICDENPSELLVTRCYVRFRCAFSNHQPVLPSTHTAHRVHTVSTILYLVRDLCILMEDIIPVNSVILVETTQGHCHLVSQRWVQFPSSIHSQTGKYWVFQTAQLVPASRNRCHSRSPTQRWPSTKIPAKSKQQSMKLNSDRKTNTANVVNKPRSSTSTFELDRKHALMH